MQNNKGMKNKNVGTRVEQEKICNPFRMEENMYDVIIIGSGPAGLSAAIYAKRAGLDVLVIEKNGLSGGQVLNTYEVDNYLGLSGVSGFELGTKFREHVDKLECKVCMEEVKELELQGEVKVVKTNKGEYETKSIILATGARHAHLDVKGEVEFTGKGVSYCATCDGAFFRDKKVAVVGGGDVAVEDAIFLARTCEKVYLIHRRDTFRATDILVKQVMALENVEIIWDTTVEEIKGNSLVEEIQLVNKLNKEVTNLTVDGVFVAVGVHPNVELVEGQLDCDKSGYILAGEDCETKIKGVYVAGDMRKKPMRQIITAVADGANAAMAVLRSKLE